MTSRAGCCSNAENGCAGKLILKGGLCRIRIVLPKLNREALTCDTRAKGETQDCMRIYEIIGEGGADPAKRARDIWKQTQRSHEALRRLRSKQQDVNDAKAAARSLPDGPERSRRSKAADRQEADARRAFGAAQSAAHDKITQTLAKSGAAKRSQ